jgi:glutathione S-transferase
MKLYYSPGACSLSPHIALQEAGLAFEKVAPPPRRTSWTTARDYYTINPLGYVPLLALDDGTLSPKARPSCSTSPTRCRSKQLAPANGTLARTQMQSWLNFIGTELHRGFGPLFNPSMPAEAERSRREAWPAASSGSTRSWPASST